MTRRLCSLTLSAFALLFLMGASANEQEADTIAAKEERTSISECGELPSKLANNSEQDAVSGYYPLGESVEAAAVSAESPLVLRQNTEAGMKIDGRYADISVGLSVRGDVSYVSLLGMAKALDSSAAVSYDSASGVATVTTGKLKLTAKVGQQYLEANGRYFYLPDGVKTEGNQVIVPLWAVAKAFDAKIGWDAQNEIVLVTCGSGAVESGDSFYDQDTLFWLSRIIYAESGNQILDGRMAVGNVIMNRVESPNFPNTITGVLSQKNQFSPWNGGKLADRTPSAGSVIAAKLVMDGGVVRQTRSALYFDATGTSWASRNRQFLTYLDGHYFYL